ncbi:MULTISPECIES: phage tail tape measure protein [Brucella/Ochrobactrum group]|jgi:hypothetical protein|uniref:Phage tail tape measure protein n=1 Tax=Brucella pseudintermedia TaxID=370111 RepID=A0ABY5UG33_9HYPH|nr:MULTISPECIES: phage tail tape measure protein [Brucella/Ochrobactrum group]KAB2684489.1 phage tail tape measure protein [Brucella pseudintermedia]MCO7729102.1 phage tail tape measure protein [Brucella intermedia]NKE74820.1 phage tail tape measure protein [Ochrobactrum sp. MC-1LL]UWL62315.1 phage tail tape measure protein [Brucella pseudintermedia]WPM82713.1 phage tail tape measure protein [Brucella pseudintermedia]
MKAQGVVQEDYQRRLKTSRGFTDRLHATIENLNASLGVALLPAFNDIADKVSEVANKLAAFAEANPKLTRSIVMVTSSLIGMRFALTGLQFLGLMGKGGALSVASFAIGSIGKASSLTGSILSGTLGKAITKVSGHFGTLAVRSKLATAATGKAPGVFARLADAGIVAGRGLLKMLNPLNLLRGGFSILRGAAVVLRGALMFTGVGAVLAGIAAAGTLIYNNWEGLKSFFVGVGEGFVKALEPVKPIIEPIAKFSTDIFNSISNLLGPLGATNAVWKSWGETVGVVVGGAVSTILEKISTLVGWLRSGVEAEAAGKLMSALSGPVGPRSLPYTVTGGSDGSGGVNTPSYMGGAIVPDGKRAEGGPISAGSSYLVGEEGAESRATSHGYQQCRHLS